MDLGVVEKLYKEALLATLEDLGHLGLDPYKEGRKCFRCGFYDSTFRQDALDNQCMTCTATSGYLSDLYTRQYVFPIASLGKRTLHIMYGGVVKIRDRLYYAIARDGSYAQLYDFDTGDPTMKELHFGTHKAQNLYEQRDATPTLAYALILYWPRVQAKIASQIRRKLPWLWYLPIIRDQEKMYVRIYIAAEPGPSHILATQLCEDIDEPFYPGYQVAKFTEKRVTFSYNDFRDKLSWYVSNLAKTRETYDRFRRTRPLPSNWTFEVTLESIGLDSRLNCLHGLKSVKILEHP